MVMPSKKNICDFFSIFQQLNFILFNFPESGKFVQENIKIGRNNEFLRAVIKVLRGIIRL